MSMKIVKMDLVLTEDDGRDTVLRFVDVPEEEMTERQAVQWVVDEAQKVLERGEKYVKCDN